MEVFPPTVVEALKPSITFRSLGSLQLAPVPSSSPPSSLQLAPAHSPVRSSSLPSSLQLAPQFAPAHSPVCSSSLPSLLQLTPQCAPAHSPVHSSSLQLTPTFPHSPLHPTGGGDPNTYMAIWSEMEQAGSELEQAGSWD